MFSFLALLGINSFLWLLPFLFQCIRLPTSLLINKWASRHDLLKVTETRSYPEFSALAISVPADHCLIPQPRHGATCLPFHFDPPCLCRFFPFFCIFMCIVLLKINFRLVNYMDNYERRLSHSKFVLVCINAFLRGWRIKALFPHLQTDSQTLFHLAKRKLPALVSISPVSFPQDKTSPLRIAN